MCPGGDAQAPQRVEVALWVDDDVDVPGAAEFGEPCGGGGGGAVGYCDEADGRVAVREGAEAEKEFLCDCR